jgi:tRNA (cytidine/uridine-2'-O-)-methyltransferase
LCWSSRRFPRTPATSPEPAVAVGARLHLSNRSAFRSTTQVRRAGLDYWPDLALRVWPNLDTLLATLHVPDSHSGIFLATTKGSRTYADVTYPPRTWLFFGKETAGLPAGLLSAHPGSACASPCCPANVRSTCRTPSPSWPMRSCASTAFPA